jgi:hypothetical protein
MANPKTLSEWVPIVGIVAAWVLLMLWLRRAQNTRAELEVKTGELKRRRGLAFAWSMIGAGVFMIGMMAAYWRNVTSGNEPVVAWEVIMGALCVLLGVYRLYRLGR